MTTSAISTVSTFRPRIGGLYALLLAVPLLAMLVALGVGAYAKGGGAMVIVPPALAVVVVLAWLALSGLVLGTRYVLRADELRVRFAIFWNVAIPYAAITRVDIVDSVQASAALSRRRIRIAWSDPSVPWERRCDVSPRDEPRFLALLQHRVPPLAWKLPAGDAPR